MVEVILLSRPQHPFPGANEIHFGRYLGGFTQLSPSNFRHHRAFDFRYLLTQLALERLPGKRGDQREHDGVREVDRHRRATRRQADEDTRSQKVEERNEEQELGVHLFTFR